MSNLTDNENVMAVKSCKSIEDELSLIDRLKGERDCYKNELKYANIEKEALNKLCGEQKAEIEILTGEMACLVKMEHDNLYEQTQKIKKAKSKAIKEFEKKSEKILIELYEKYHKVANKPKKETDMFYQGRAEAIWECITTNRNLVKEMVGDAD